MYIDPPMTIDYGIGAACIYCILVSLILYLPKSDRLIRANIFTLVGSFFSLPIHFIRSIKCVAKLKVYTDQVPNDERKRRRICKLYRTKVSCFIHRSRYIIIYLLV